jgi:hypothetical protein
LETTVGPVTYSKTDKAGVDTLQLYAVKDGEFKSVGKPFIPEYTGKNKINRSWPARFAGPADHFTSLDAEGLRRRRRCCNAHN